MLNSIRTIQSFAQICGLVGVCLAMQSQAARAQFLRPEPMTGVGIDYGDPKSDVHKTIRDRLMKRKALEEYREFMSPLKLDRRLSVRMKECDTPNAWYSGGDVSITFCYEWLSESERLIAKYDALPGFQKEDAVVASFVGVLLHETGHAVFDIFKIPMFGREEDAADAIASFVMLEVGKSSTRRLLAGTAHVWRAMELSRPTRAFEDHSDEHGTPAQRFYNTLCIAHGSDIAAKTNVFDDLSKLLPEGPDGNGRRGRCGKEYLQVKYAFDKLILPHIDAAALERVRAKEWILTTDGKDILPPTK
jgi:hypothetical protein